MRRTRRIREKLIFAIDPGTTKSAYVLLDGKTCEIKDMGLEPNEKVLEVVLGLSPAKIELVSEMIACYGQRVGRSVFETCVWIGRFLQAFPGKRSRMKRKEAVLHLCHRTTGSDADVRQVLIDRYGGKEVAIGNKKCKKCKGKGWFGSGRPVCPVCNGECWELPPGPLASVHDDIWAALAVGITFADQRYGRHNI